MRISTRGRYGLKVIVDIAARPEPRVSLKSIAARQGLSESYLEQIIAPLRKARIVASKRGADGGYFLAQPPESLTVGDVLRVLEGAMAPINCVLDDAEDSCGEADCGHCATRSVWVALFEKINEVLDSISIADLAKDEYFLSYERS
ncbi:MAG: Rrf2 family transcriptional regulator [Defluviitaleaceae bacterium]|nr:Rrf2 family transcriptional regulator [Defluviitaleaceae bacterium]